MINSKLEITFRFVLPISEPIGNIDKYVVVFLSVATSIMAYHIYTYHRNKKILNKINFLLENNELDEAERFINNCLAKQKKNSSVYMYKLYVLGMCGRITEFEKAISKCQQLRKYKKLLELDFVKGLICIIDYFKTSTNTCICSNRQYWGEIVDALSAQNDEKNIPELLNIYSRAKFYIIKSVVAFKLNLIYKESKNFEKAEYYYDIALQYAPSLEIEYYIEMSKKTGDGSMS